MSAVTMSAGMSSTGSATASGTRRSSIPIGCVELIYCKSKVYVHPTGSSRDNVCGYLSLSRAANSTNSDVLFSFTPESIMEPDELKTYNEVDMSDYPTERIYIVKKPVIASYASYCFSLTLSNVYSIQVRAPSLGWWWGSFVIHTKSGEKIPIIFFHDDESNSTQRRQSIKNKEFNPFGHDDQLFWGGDEMLNVLKDFAVVEKSTLEPSMFLINPDSSDLRNFVPEEAAVQKEKFNFNKLVNNARWRILETVASISQKGRTLVKETIQDQTPEPVRKLLLKPEVQKIGEDFDSARVYLAKWAIQVQDDAESSKNKFILSDSVTKKINEELGKDILTQQEISSATRRKEISRVEWESFFDYSGRLRITIAEVEERIFHGGVNETLRSEVWLFLLGVYPWDSSAQERKTIVDSYRTAYEELKRNWKEDEDKQHEEFWLDQKTRIEKDINRTDRELKLYKNGDSDSADGTGHDISKIRNPHLYKLREILITYNEYNQNLGYVQGMTDLLSPLYVILQDEELTFWCFVKFMDRMERNFVRDQSGMKTQMSTLNELVQFMLPELYIHLTKCESNNLFFFFRMLLVWFKREFEWDDMLKLWEIFFTDYYSSQFHLFFALAILAKHEKVIENHLTAFDEVLKYMNDLSMTMNLSDLSVRSELLFLRFKRMVGIIDRERALSNDHQLSPISDELRGLLSKKLIIQKEVPRPEGVGGG